MSILIIFLGNKSWEGLNKKGSVGENISRWFAFCSGQPVFQKACSIMSSKEKQKPNSQSSSKTEQKVSGVSFYIKIGGFFND